MLTRVFGRVKDVRVIRLMGSLLRSISARLFPTFLFFFLVFFFFFHPSRLSDTSCTHPPCYAFPLALHHDNTNSLAMGTRSLVSFYAGNSRVRIDAQSETISFIPPLDHCDADPFTEAGNCARSMFEPPLLEAGVFCEQISSRWRSPRRCS